MSAIVVDTHTVLWYLFADPELSRRAKAAMESATEEGEPIYVPTICIVEATYLTEKNRIPARKLELLRGALLESGSAFEAMPLTTEIAFALSRIARNEVPDLPDRVIAATALALGLVLVTCDGKIRASGIETLW